VQEALLEARDRPPPGAEGQMVVVSGHCPDGADALAEQVAERWGWTVEPHPADWGRLGRVAGFERNAEMVRLGADVCLAFLDHCTSTRCLSRAPHGSHGTKHCAGLAAEAGIPVRWYATA